MEIFGVAAAPTFVCCENLKTFIRSFPHSDSNLATSTNFIYMRMQSQMKNKIARRKKRERIYHFSEKLIINCMQLQPWSG